MIKCKDNCANHVQELLEEIEQLRDKLDNHRWISVEKSLPEKDGQVWICYEENGYTYGAYYGLRYNLWQIFDPCGGYSDVDHKSPPTHWKPIILPEGKVKETT